jgi:flagellar biosynthesis protein
MSDANPDDGRFAAALSYIAGQDAPKVVAKGQRLVADEIVRRAIAAGVPVHSSSALASLLQDVPLDQSIPPQLYRVIAELLAWVYRIEHGDVSSFDLLDLSETPS